MNRLVTPEEIKSKFPLEPSRDEYINLFNTLIREAASEYKNCIDVGYKECITIHNRAKMSQYCLTKKYKNYPILSEVFKEMGKLGYKITENFTTGSRFKAEFTYKISW